MTPRPALYRVRLTFVPGGPAVTGYWADPSTAERKMREDIGTYGSHPTVRITLDEERADGSWATLAEWTRDGGERRTA
ncbi:hypothetical protein [Streptomyces sp. HUAS TT7]|uniref:hypothetical protein n=1 Tax=Streptomyces sp. HUAS TT7 TaxID=3447507 RepID=UPI003F65AE02